MNSIGYKSWNWNNRETKKKAKTHEKSGASASHILKITNYLHKFIYFQQFDNSSEKTVLLVEKGIFYKIFVSLCMNKFIHMNLN